MTHNKQAERTAWDILDIESAKAYYAFCCYRDLEPNVRSFTKAYEKYRANTKTASKIPSRSFQQWSVKFDWVERARQCDAYKSQKAMELQVFEDVRIAKEIKHLMLAKLKQAIESSSANQLIHESTFEDVLVQYRGEERLAKQVRQTVRSIPYGEKMLDYLLSNSKVDTDQTTSAVSPEFIAEAVNAMMNRGGV